MIKTEVDKNSTIEKSVSDKEQSGYFIFEKMPSLVD